MIAHIRYVSKMTGCACMNQSEVLSDGTPVVRVQYSHPYQFLTLDSFLLPYHTTFIILAGEEDK
jgi:hypothetical protein